VAVAQLFASEIETGEGEILPEQREAMRRMGAL
jgi:hypothetical protein